MKSDILGCGWKKKTFVKNKENIYGNICLLSNSNFSWKIVVLSIIFNFVTKWTLKIGNWSKISPNNYEVLVLYTRNGCTRDAYAPVIFYTRIHVI